MLKTFSVLLLLGTSLIAGPFMEVLKASGLKDTLNMYQGKITFTNMEMTLPSAKKSYLLQDIVRMKFDMRGVNLAYRSKVTASSSIEEVGGWSKNNVVNGVKGSLSYISSSNAGDNHTEWIAIELDRSFPLNKINLYGGSGLYGNKPGEFFPKDFTLQVSADSLKWDTVATCTHYPAPGAAVQSFSFTERNVKFFRLVATVLSGSRLSFSEIELWDTLAVPATKEEESASKQLWNTPRHFELTGAAPNPFYGTTRIAFGVPALSDGRASFLTVDIYDAAGRLVQTLVKGVLAPGYHSVMLGPLSSGHRRAVSGTYFCRMRGDGFSKTIKLALMR